MRKLKYLSQTLSLFGLNIESKSILKLARESDEIYHNIATKLLGWLETKPQPYNTYDFGVYYQIPYDLLKDEQYLKEYADWSTYDKVGEEERKSKKFIHAYLIFYKPHTEDELKDLALKKGEVGSKEYNQELERLKKQESQGRWQEAAGSMEATYIGSLNATSIMINIYPNPSDWEKHKNNIIEYLLSSESVKSIFIHEVTHAINRIRNNPEKDFRAKGGLKQFNVETKEYANSTEEIQARLIQVFAEIRKNIIESCPTLNYKDCDKSDFSSWNYIYNVLDGDPTSFIERVMNYSGISRYEDQTNPDMKRKYASRILEMYYYFRKLLKFEDDKASGFATWSNENMSEKERSRRESEKSQLEFAKKLKEEAINDPFDFLQNRRGEEYKEYHRMICEKLLNEHGPAEFIKFNVWYENLRPWLNLAAERLIADDPEGFIDLDLTNYFDKSYLDSAMRKILDKLGAVNFIDKYLTQSYYKGWLIEYLGLAAKELAQSDPELFLQAYSYNPWAEPYKDLATKSSIERDPFLFYDNNRWGGFSEENLDLVAKAMIEKDPNLFLHNFRYQFWAEPYISLAESKIQKVARQKFLGLVLNALC